MRCCCTRVKACFALLWSATARWEARAADCILVCCASITSCCAASGSATDEAARIFTRASNWERSAEDVGGAGSSVPFLGGATVGPVGAAGSASMDGTVSWASARAACVSLCFPLAVC